jgi:hypothetical protein
MHLVVLPDSDMSDGVRLLFENGGVKCYAARPPGGTPDIKAALAALDKVDNFNWMI